MRHRWLWVLLAAVVCVGPAAAQEEEEEADPAEVAIGERLDHSGPYLHTGKADTLEDVVRTYVEASELARAGTLRNGATELARMRIGEADVDPLVAFLRALNEDYE